MKNKILLLTFILAAFLIMSCQKKDAPQAAAEPAFEAEIASGSMKQGFALVINSGFYTMENDTGEETDITKWAASMSLGQRVAIGEARRATYNTPTGRAYNYVKVRRDNGSEGFAMAIQVAEAGRLAVVSDEKGANLFRSPSTIDVSSLILSYKTVVVYYPETEKDGYVQIRAYDPVKEFFVQNDNNFVRLSSLSVRNSDIQSSILLQTALALENSGQQKVRRDALLESALLDYPDSVFYPEIMQTVNPNTVGVILSTTSRYRGETWSVNDNNVNVRDLPDTAKGKVIGSLGFGDMVTIVEETTEQYQIDGTTSNWVKISTPVEGWVFGAFLDRK